ncbi:hypothetical protein [Gray Lodge virus]|uniref:Uncharacterized protein n=1 Tax=Gray Lodge virus TaxID=1272942 RepID=A0A0D3R251_9RHAB|nr:hypothetical protein [Gray Lodge virus]AJR28577.1 hypothetical protein [Gray Lodge virus]
MLYNTRLEVMVVGDLALDTFGAKLELFMGMYKKVVGQFKDANTLWRSSLLMLLANAEETQTVNGLNQIHCVILKLIDYQGLEEIQQEESFYRQTSFVPINPGKDAGAWVILDLIPAYGSGESCQSIWEDAESNLSVAKYLSWDEANRLFKLVE